MGTVPLLTYVAPGRGIAGMADSQADSQPRGEGNLLERNPQVVLGPDSGKDPGTVGQALFKYLAEGQAY